MKRITLFLALALIGLTGIAQSVNDEQGMRGPDQQWLGANSNTVDLHRFGNVGIGTDSYTDGTTTYKLSVDGKVRATSVKVYNDWADFVFEADYDLPTLREVEAHIDRFGHLIDIPSAAEVAEEGIDLGQMNKLLLQKVEELTLYVIDLNKRVAELEKN